MGGSASWANARGVTALVVWNLGAGLMFPSSIRRLHRLRAAGEGTRREVCKARWPNLLREAIAPEGLRAAGIAPGAIRIPIEHPRPAATAHTFHTSGRSGRWSGPTHKPTPVVPAKARRRRRHRPKAGIRGRRQPKARPGLRFHKSHAPLALPANVSVESQLIRNPLKPPRILRCSLSW